MAGKTCLLAFLSKVKRKKYTQTYLNPPHPTRTQCPSSGNSCICTSPAPPPSCTPQFHSAWLPHQPPMPSKPLLPRQFTQRPCTAKAAPAASTEPPMPQPSWFSWRPSKPPLLPPPFVEPPPPPPFFRPLQPLCLSVASRPPPLLPSRPLRPPHPSGPSLRVSYWVTRS